ncbi:MAG: DUF4402 domain-containing protein [Novosphingobium sp.]
MALTCALLAMPASTAQADATATGEAQAQVVVPLLVVPQQELSFGAVFASTAAGSVLVEATGETRYAGGAAPALLMAGGFASHPALFAVRGEPFHDYAIGLPGAIIATGTLSDGSGGAAPPLTVGALTVRSESQPSANRRGTLDQDGKDRFRVGGTIEIPGGTPAARYQAVVPVIVTYN